MNDDEIEQLVSRLARPSPSPALDVRIADVTRLRQAERIRSPVRGALRLGGAMACAGVLGFLLGRQSVSSPPAEPPVAETAAQHRSPAEPEVVEGRAFVPANQDFIRLVTKPNTFASVFGNQPLEARTRPSPIQ